MDQRTEYFRARRFASAWTRSEATGPASICLLGEAFGAARRLTAETDLLRPRQSLWCTYTSIVDAGWKRWPDNSERAVDDAITMLACTEAHKHFDRL